MIIRTLINFIAHTVVGSVVGIAVAVLVFHWTRGVPIHVLLHWLFQLTPWGSAAT